MFFCVFCRTEVNQKTARLETYVPGIITPRLARVLHIVALVLPTMTLSSTSDSSSIFKDGKLKPGIYKIQNLYAQTYMDIHEHSRDVCCRPATALGEGRGLVRPFQQPVARVSDD